jgi:hypothetical protein
MWCFGFFLEGIKDGGTTKATVAQSTGLRACRAFRCLPYNINNNNNNKQKHDLNLIIHLCINDSLFVKLS